MYSCIFLVVDVVERIWGFIYFVSRLVFAFRDSVLNGSLQRSLSSQVCYPLGLRHGAMDPNEGTHDGRMLTDRTSELTLL